MQGFIIPELVIESVVRDGFLNVRADKTIIDSIFAQLTRAYNTTKYGEAEITKIKALIDKEIPVIYSYADVDAHPTSISIMVGEDTEDKNRAHIDDFYEERVDQIVDADELEALHRVDDLVVTAYDPVTGKVTCDPATDLSPIYKGMIYVDSAAVEHDILSGISNVPGDKFFFIGKNNDVDFSDNSAFIKSSLDYKKYEMRGVTGEERLVIGCHSKDALTAKYLYVLVKYFILSRKKDLIKRSFYLATYAGSDFHRNQEFVGDRVFTRFLTVTGKIDDTWRSDQVVLIDNVVIDGTPVE